MSDESHKKALEVAQQMRKKVAEYAKTVLHNSERCGNTPTEKGFSGCLDQYFKTQFAAETYPFTDQEKALIQNEVNNFSGISLVPAYRTSLKSSKREVNGKMPVDVTDAWLNDSKKKLRDIEGALLTKAKQTMSDSVRTGKTPARNQMLSYLKTEAEKLIAEQGDSLDDQAKIYLRNYTFAYVKDTCGAVYDASLAAAPRKTTNDFPWTANKEESKTAGDKSSAATKIIESANAISKYRDTNQSFSGSDMVCSIDITLPNGTKIVKVIGSLQTLTYSIHQDKRPVRAVGNMNAIDYVFGQRTIAGTLIFAVFNKHWAHEIMDEYKAAGANVHFLMDELPPFQITISAANEYGYSARLALYGVRIVNEGQVMAVNDVYTENSYQFVATDLDYLSDATGYSKRKGVNNTNLPTMNKNPALPVAPSLPVVRNPEDEEEPKPVDPTPSSDPVKPKDDPKPPANPYKTDTLRQALDKIESQRAAATAEIDANAAAGKYKNESEERRVRVATNAIFSEKSAAAMEYFDTH